MAVQAKVPSRETLIADALREHAAQFRAFVGARVPPGEVEDILQTAAFRAVERSGSLKDSERLLPWLYRLHRNIIVDTMRRRASRERVVDPHAVAPEPSAQPSEDPCHCALVLARQLSPAYASMLSLVDAGDASVAEAAEALGISTNNAAVRLHRARKALRKAMLEHCGVRSPSECADCRCAFEGCCAM
ncbi:MAG: sigma-70 family RNA polymerase sigma factor [Myxococcota bacterium]